MVAVSGRYQASRNRSMMAAFAGPLMVGALWRGVTKYGAYAGLVAGFVTFLILHTQQLNPEWFGPGWLRDVVTWLQVKLWRMSQKA